MNKKILLGILMIGLVSALAGAGVYAYFSDTETSTENVFTAGEINLSIDPTDGQDVVTIEGALDLKPCETGYTGTTITNVGPNPATIWKHMTNVLNDENEITDAEGKYYLKYPNSVNRKISNWIHYDLLVARPFYATRNMEMIWGTGLNELDGELVVEINYGGGKTLFKATAPSDYGTNGMMTFTFDMANDGLADFQIQWAIGIGWRYSEVDEVAGKWVKDIPTDESNWKSVPGKYVTTKSGRTYTLEVPAEDSGIPYKFGVDSNDQADGNGQIFLSTDPEHIWYYDGSYVSSHWYLTIWPFSFIIEETDGFTMTGTEPVECSWIYLGTLNPGETMYVVQSYHLDETVDNWGQSDQVTFDIEYLAQQIGATEPDPLLSLP